ncbi:Dephospho-CoA kinase [plant metagenome]|uniref:Dephospho-CoA kinase n=1 Tax=plant metagenome TaxID=1297885 RepID=A0A484QV17_9ZZZZ
MDANDPASAQGKLAIGLTGGIGSGKTRVADLLAQWGASVIDTDLIAHALTGPGGEAMPALRDAFGPDIVAADGAMDRAAMRERVFADPGARQRLEAVLHPLIGARAAAEGAQAQGDYVVYVVPLLVESGRWRERVARICVVDCEPETQVARVRTRSRLTIDTIRRIMAAQATREARLAAADDVIVNVAATTPQELASRTLELHECWRELARSTRRSAS